MSARKLIRMARLVSDAGEEELPDGSSMADAAEKLGVVFGCNAGACMTCQVEVLEGAENLEPKTESEIEMRLEPGVRLACQCRVKKGSVKIRF
jgi:ferredoxin